VRGRDLTAIRTTSPVGWGRSLRLLACIAAAALWLMLAFAVTRVAFARAGDIGNCSIFERQVVGVDTDWPLPRYTCVYREPDGTTIRQSRYATPIVIMVIGLVVGVVPAATFLWVGLGRPDLRHRRGRW